MRHANRVNDLDAQSDGARLSESQQVRQHGEGWIIRPRPCARKCCGSQTSETGAPTRDYPLSGSVIRPTTEGAS